MANKENPYPFAWFVRGVQSAIFYYVACTPCTKLQRQRDQKKQDRRDRAEREWLEKTGAGMLYRQPSPYATNEYWADEIRSGPGPPPQRAKKHKDTNKSRTSDTGNSRVTNNTTPVPDQPRPSSIDGSGTEKSTKAAVPAGGMPEHQHTTIEDVKTMLRHPAETWNNRRRNYQREDEELWGVESSTTSNSSSHNSRIRPRLHPRHFSVGHIGPSISAGLARLAQKQETSVQSFYTARNPPVNDLHPPIVSVPIQSKEANQWMLQPPPSASVMSGKERVTRAVEDSSCRNMNAAGGQHSLNGGSLRSERGLHRRMSKRLVAEKMKNKDRTGDFLWPIDPNRRDRSTSSKKRRKKDFSDESTNRAYTVVHKGSSVNSREIDNATPDLSDITTLTGNTISTTNTENTARRDFAFAPITPLTPSTPQRRRAKTRFQPHPRLQYVPTPVAYSPNSDTSSPSTPATRHRRKLSSNTRSYLFAYPLPLPTPLKEDPEYARRARLAALGECYDSINYTDLEEDEENAEVSIPRYSRPSSSFHDSMDHSPTIEAITAMDSVLSPRTNSDETFDNDKSQSLHKEDKKDLESHRHRDELDDHEQKHGSWNSHRRRWSMGF